MLASNMDQVWIGLALALPSFSLGYLAYKRSVKVDEASIQSGATSDTRAGTAQIIEGLNILIGNIQEDNASFRADLKECALRIQEVTRERDELRRELAEFRSTTLKS